MRKVAAASKKKRRIELWTANKFQNRVATSSGNKSNSKKQEEYSSMWWLSMSFSRLMIASSTPLLRSPWSTLCNDWFIIRIKQIKIQPCLVKQLIIFLQLFYPLFSSFLLFVFANELLGPSTMALSSWLLLLWWRQNGRKSVQGWRKTVKDLWTNESNTRDHLQIP